MRKIICLLFLASAASAQSPSITTFTTGQVDPRVRLRSDFAKYKSSCTTLENFLVCAQGPANRRPGTRYIPQFDGFRYDYQAESAYVYIVSGDGAGGAYLYDDDYATVATALNPPYSFTYHVVQSSDGYFYSGSGLNASNLVAPVKLDPNFAVISGWPSYETWNTDSHSTVTAVRPTHDGEYVYVLTNAGVGAQKNHITKLVASTGAFVWRITEDDVTGTLGGWDIGVDSSGNIYVPGYYKDGNGSVYPAKLDGDGSVLLDYSASVNYRSTYGDYRVAVVESLGLWFTCGYAIIVPEVGICSAYSTSTAVREWEFNPWDGAGHARSLTYKDGYIYLAVDNKDYSGDNTVVFKVGASNGSVASYAGPFQSASSDAQDVFLNSDNQIVLVSDDSDTSPYQAYVLSDDLTVLTRYDPEGTIFFMEQLPDWYLWGEEAIVVETAVSANSARRLIPFPYSTDDSYVLALGENFMGFFRTEE